MIEVEKTFKELSRKLNEELKEFQATRSVREDIQNSLLASIDSDIRIVKHKIDDMKEEYRRFDDDADFVDRLEALYGELGDLLSRRDAINYFPYTDPITLDSAHRKMASYILDKNPKLDRLNADL